MGYVGKSNIAYIVLKITNNWKIKFNTNISLNPSALFKSIILNKILANESIEIKKITKWVLDFKYNVNLLNFILNSSVKLVIYLKNHISHKKFSQLVKKIRW